MSTFTIKKINGRTVDNTVTTAAITSHSLIIADTGGAIVYSQNKTAAKMDEYQFVETFTAVETALSTQVKRITATKINGREYSNRPLLFDKDLDWRAFAKGAGSEVHFTWDNKAKPMIVECLESPAAISAGNSSSTGSGL